MASKSVPTVKSVGKSLADFRASHDKAFIVPNKINGALKKLGPKSWEYEIDLMRLAGGISSGDISAYRDQFADHIVVVGGKNPKRIWCGSAAFATELRSMVP